MIVYRLKRKTHIGSGWSKMALDNDVIFFKNKEDAKALQNPFNGDKVDEVILTKDSKFIYNLRLIFNTASWGRSFESLNEAKHYCQTTEKGNHDREVYKNKIYNSLNDYHTSKYEPKMIFA